MGTVIMLLPYLHVCPLDIDLILDGSWIICSIISLFQMSLSAKYVYI